jgi:hypothetical protein
MKPSDQVQYEPFHLLMYTKFEQDYAYFYNHAFGNLWKSN